MKKILCILLVLLLLTGCQSGTEGTDPAGTTVAPTVNTDPMEIISPETEPPETTIPAAQDPTAPPDEITFTEPGKVRIGYEGTRSFVKYITSPEELPDMQELEGFDAGFFQDHALVLVVETVNSGSVQLEIEAMLRSGDEVTVTLKRSMSGEVGTSDMATWLLWAVVDKGYDCTWSLETENVLHNVTKY